MVYHEYVIYDVLVTFYAFFFFTAQSHNSPVLRLAD